VSWVPDFWGKIRDQVREYQYGGQVSAADHRRIAKNWNWN
jgi:hypothetical protein